MKLFSCHVFVQTMKLGFLLCTIFERFSEKSVKKHWTVAELSKIYLYDNINFDEASMLFIPFCWTNLWKLVEIHIKDKLVIKYGSLQTILFEANHNLMKIRCLIQNFITVSFLKWSIMSYLYWIYLAQTGSE